MSGKYQKIRKQEYKNTEIQKYQEQYKNKNKY